MPGVNGQATAPAVADLTRFCALALGPLGRDVPDPLRADLHLVNDLGFDSLELYEFQVLIEELCGQALPDDLLAQIDTLGAAFEWCRVKAGQSAPRPDRRPARPPLRPGSVNDSTRRVRLRAVDPSDYEWLYELTTRSENLVRWRDRGTTYRVEEWADRLWAGVAAQFIGVAVENETPLGLVTVYNHDARNRHARLAAIFDDRVAAPGWRLEAVGLVLDYAFEVFDLLKLYAEVVDFNFDAFSSGLDTLFVEEGLLHDYEYAHGRHWPVHVLAFPRDRFESFRDVWLPRSLGTSAAAPR
jgi:acyl carrier protein/RimJ/RimL family protein N-acetyltransferase